LHQRIDGKRAEKISPVGRVNFPGWHWHNEYFSLEKYHKQRGIASMTASDA
jgi:hypothetical protein